MPFSRWVLITNPGNGVMEVATGSEERSLALFAESFVNWEESLSSSDSTGLKMK